MHECRSPDNSDEEDECDQSYMQKEYKKELKKNNPDKRNFDCNNEQPPTKKQFKQFHKNVPGGVPGELFPPPPIVPPPFGGFGGFEPHIPGFGWDWPHGGNGGGDGPGGPGGGGGGGGPPLDIVPPPPGGGIGYGSPGWLFGAGRRKHHNGNDNGGKDHPGNRNNDNLDYGEQGPSFGTNKQNVSNLIKYSETLKRFTRIKVADYKFNDDTSDFPYVPDQNVPHMMWFTKTPLVQNINTICLGPGQSQRVGNTIVMHKLSIQLVAAVINNLFDLFTTIRLSIVYDVAPNGSYPAFTDIFNTSTSMGVAQPSNFYDPININNEDRFIVIWDKYMIINEMVYGNPSQYIINKDINMFKLQTKYQASNCNIGDLTRGATYVVAGQLCYDTVPTVGFSGNFRLFYSDAI